MRHRAVYLFGITCLLTPALSYGQAEVVFSGGLLTVRCSDVPLSQIFEQIKTETGIELILEDPIKTKRLTAEIEAQPVPLALERLLQGSGVNYAMLFNPQDWTHVTKIFIGSGGGGSSSPAQAASPSTPVRRRPVQRAQPADDYEQPEEMMDMMDEEEPPPEEEQFVEEPPVEEDFGAPDMGGEAAPDFTPPAPSYPRSRFTPGLEQNPFRTTRPQGQQQAPPQQEADPNTPPPAYYPFLDPFGRPIPVPPEAQPQQQPQKKNPQ